MTSIYEIESLLSPWRDDLPEEEKEWILLEIICICQELLNDE